MDVLTKLEAPPIFFCFEIHSKSCFRLFPFLARALEEKMQHSLSLIGTLEKT